jgi:glycosyltransferase involved in cell wall biosynthesis
MAMNFTGDIKKIHIGYSNFNGGRPKYLPDDFDQFLEIDTRNFDKKHIGRISTYIRNHRIEVVFGFDQPVSAPAYRAIRKAGVRLFISYWGAPMSSLNRGAKLLIKKLEVLLRRNKPDHYIFESDAMAETAIFGRGIHPADVSVISLGVNTDRFKPDPAYAEYAHREFSIPPERKIVFYSGHMQERKGVRVIIHAANELICGRGRKDLHFLLLGNRDGEEMRFHPLYVGKESEKFITFGGYRQDIPRILPSCTIGVIASTGWDSFTVSSLEMSASGLPLIVSELQGLKETIDPEITGFLFPPGDHLALAERMERLLDDPSRQAEMGLAGRKRVVDRYSERKQVDNLTELLTRLYGKALIEGDVASPLE